MNFISSTVCLGAIAALLLSAGPASAASVHENILHFGPKAMAKIHIERRKRLRAIEDSEQSRGVYYLSTLWPPSHRVVRVCFFDEDLNTRRNVAAAAADWNTVEAGIKLDFGDMEDPRRCNPDDGMEDHIRVSFHDPAGGYWSWYGYESVVYVPQDKPSLNLHNIDVEPFDGWWHGRILHEFGHALGLIHEHQNPAAKCSEEFDWPQIYKRLGDPPSNWTKQFIDDNMREIFGEDVVAEDFDVKSVMLYTFDPKFYVKGEQSRCYAKDNFELSAGDRKTLLLMYPPAASARAALYEETRKSLRAILAKENAASKPASLDPLMMVLPQQE